VSVLTYPRGKAYTCHVAHHLGGSDPSWVAGIGVLNSERTSAHHSKRFFCAPLFMADAARALRSADSLICTPTLRYSPPSIGVVGGSSSLSEDSAMSIPAQVPTTSIANTAIRQDIDDAGSYYIKPRKPTPIGQKFNRLTIISDAPDTIRKNNSLRRNVQCLCECGKIKTIDYFRVTSGGAQSCGCLQKERASKACKTHGHTVIKHTKEYKAWSHMKQRCINTNDKSYSYYGGRGITVCQQWIESFDAFLNNVGYAPKLKDVSIGRIDNNGNYEPGNVRWEQRADQNLNTRRNVFIEFNGETKTIKEWADLYNLKYDTLRMRLKSGWSVHDALTKELRKWN
jgi:hypothetical protein